MQFAERRDFSTSAPRSHPNEELAFKFFVDRAEYDVESKMYRGLSRSLRPFAPKVDKYVDNKNGAMKDPFGNPLPPCIIMCRGQSILDKARNSRVDVFSAAGVRCCMHDMRIESHQSLHFVIFRLGLSPSLAFRVYRSDCVYNGSVSCPCVRFQLVWYPV